MINLSKGGEKVNLSKEAPSLQRLLLKLTWDENQFDGDAFDPDLEAFCFGDNRKVFSEEDFIFYSHTTHAGGFIKHSGDDRTGGTGETIAVDLTAVPNQYMGFGFTITIDGAEAKRQNFGVMSNAMIQVVNADNDEIVLTYDLSEDFSNQTALVACEVYKHNGEWQFKAIGKGWEGGLVNLCSYYGISAEYR